MTGQGQLQLSIGKDKSQGKSLSVVPMTSQHTLSTPWQLGLYHLLYYNPKLTSSDVKTSGDLSAVPDQTGSQTHAAYCVGLVGDFYQAYRFCSSVVDRSNRQCLEFLQHISGKASSIL